jgi:hypothetical protein
MNPLTILLAVGALLSVDAQANADVGANVIIALDAESLSWTVPAQIARDPNALGGKYVILPKKAGKGGSGSARVQLPRKGDYYLWARIKAGGDAGHSFDVEFDGADYTWLIAIPRNWHWERVANTDRSGTTTPVVVSINAPGAHTLKVLEEADGTGSLDELVITNNAYFVPVDHCHR